MDNMININVLMCKKTDENITCIENIFDTIGWENKSISFDIVTIINLIHFTRNKFTLIYTIEKLNDNNKNKAMLLDIKELTSDKSMENTSNKQKHHFKSSLRDTGQSIFSEHFSDIEFLGCGYYELQVHMLPEEETSWKKNSDDFLNKLCGEKEYIKCTYGFQIVPVV